MSDEGLHHKRMTRRAFLKYTALAGASMVGGSAVINLVGCAPAAAPTVIPTPTPGKIKIGGIFSLSGVVGAWGQAGKKGATLAAEEINANGGVLGNQIELIFEDDEVNAEVGVRKARKLVLEDGVDFLIGINSSGVALAVTPVLEELKRILVIPCAASPRVTNEAFNKYVFRSHANSYQIGAAGAFLAKDFPAKRWTVIGPDYAYGWDSWGAFISHLIRLKPDVEVLEVQGWPKLLSGEYESHISRILEAKPDAVYSPLWGGDMAAFIKQASKFNFFDKVLFFTPAGLALDIFYALQEEIPDNLYSASHGYWFEEPQTERNKAFVQRFFERFGEYPHIVAHDAYGTIYLLKKAIEKAGTKETEAVIEAMEGLEFETPGYNRRIRKIDHQAVTDVPWGRTEKTEELKGLKSHLTDVIQSPGEQIMQPEEEVLAIRGGAKPEYLQYIIK